MKIDAIVSQDHFLDAFWRLFVSCLSPFLNVRQYVYQNPYCYVYLNGLVLLFKVDKPLSHDQFKKRKNVLSWVSDNYD